MMAKISDDIREWCNDAYSGKKIRTTKDLYAIADLIDRETVELPRSVDGRIWTGREVCFWTGSAGEDWHKFCGLHYSDGRWCVEDKDFERYPAVSVWYERPDSLERVAYDIETIMPIDDEDDERLRHELADRILRLAAKEEVGE